jgi:hypothetical protein
MAMTFDKILQDSVAREKFLDEIDAELTAEEVPIGFRSILALRKISEKLNIAIGIGSPAGNVVNDWFNVSLRRGPPCGAVFFVADCPYGRE